MAYASIYIAAQRDSSIFPTQRVVPGGKHPLLDLVTCSLRAVGYCSRWTSRLFDHR